MESGLRRRSTYEIQVKEAHWANCIVHALA